MLNGDQIVQFGQHDIIEIFDLPFYYRSIFIRVLFHILYCQICKTICQKIEKILRLDSVVRLIILGRIIYHIE
jgi:hypothetical protein